MKHTRDIEAQGPFDARYIAFLETITQLKTALQALQIVDYVGVTGNMELNPHLARTRHSSCSSKEEVPQIRLRPLRISLVNREQFHLLMLNVDAQKALPKQGFSRIVKSYALMGSTETKRPI